MSRSICILVLILTFVYGEDATNNSSATDLSDYGASESENLTDLNYENNDNDYLPINLNTNRQNFFLNSRNQKTKHFASEIIFLIFKNGKRSYIANGSSVESLNDIGCNSNDKFTLILHGWQEDAETEWIPLMVANFSEYRGGCIIVADYGYYSVGSYLKLVQKFDAITYVIYSKLKLWQNYGLNLNQLHIFGFSYGARLGLAVGRKFGKQIVKSIDTCDMAGPGFDIRYSRSDLREAAENVQCIHTSRDKGTRFYTNCHQNWRLGNCGYSQPGAEEPPYGSHGLCVYYYMLAFKHGFYAHKKPNICNARNPAFQWPEKFRMGYMETRQSQVEGELFVPLSADYPYALEFPQGKFDDNVIIYAMVPKQAIESIRKFRNRPVIRRLIKARREFMKQRRSRFDF